MYSPESTHEVDGINTRNRVEKTTKTPAVILAMLHAAEHNIKFGIIN